MDCPDCGAPTVAFAVPPDLRAYAPEGTSEDASGAAICTRCLRVHPAESDAGDPDVDVGGLADFFPEGEAGVALALALGLLDSLALNRDAIETLLRRVERAGADPFLVLDRLAAAGRIDPHFDVDRRRDQLEQLL